VTDGSPLQRLVATGRRWGRRDAIVLFGLLLLATLARFAFLASRGTWDADQGHDMLVLDSLVHRGILPLLGPPTSIGTFHHGAVYYYLLAPAAALTDANPVGVVAFIAACGVAAVGVTWWLGRAIGGRAAGFVAGLLMAVSAAAINESTFIWNPNLIAFSSALALAATWRAWNGGRPVWWVAALVAAGVTMQCHVLGIVLLPIVAAPLIAAARREEAGLRRSGIVRAGLMGVALIAVMYVPLAIHEVGHDFSETRAILAYIASGGEPATLDPVSRLLVVGLRVLAWPLTGLVTDAPEAAIVAAIAVIAILVWRSRATDPAAGAERRAMRWLGAGVAWSVIALSVAAGGLTSVVPGLPTDHYHAFLDPIVFVTAGLGAAALVRRPDVLVRRLDALGPALAIAAVATVTVFNLAHWPPPTAPDGGWPAAEAAATRIVRTTGDRSIALLSVPTFKAADAIAFPLVREGAVVAPLGSASALVVVCDRLFEPIVGAACGGPAEEATLGPTDATLRLADRFDASSRTAISVYLPPLSARGAARSP
jgi:4-amino-4-deoxy-L-arabinose transferase-like glycosyltransferase